MISRASSLALCVALGVGGVLARPAAAGTEYDGKWKIHAIAAPGRCDDDFTVRLIVVNNHVNYTGLIAMFASGDLSVAGALSLKVGEAKVTGHLVRDAGGGRWASPACAGTWTAIRN